MPYKLTPLLASLTPWREALHEKLAAVYRTAPASVPTSERPALAAALAERRQALEVEEERIVLLAGVDGIELPRRPEADAAIVLTTILVLAEP